MYNPADIRWDVLNDIMSSYYLHNHQILGLNGVECFSDSDVLRWIKHEKSLDKIQEVLINVVHWKDYILKATSSTDILFALLRSFRLWPVELATCLEELGFHM